MGLDTVVWSSSVGKRIGRMLDVEAPVVLLIMRLYLQKTARYIEIGKRVRR